MLRRTIPIVIITTCLSGFAFSGTFGNIDSLFSGAGEGKVLSLEITEIEAPNPVSSENGEILLHHDTAAKAQNKIGRITGGMNHSPVDITLNKVEWTITGGINLSPIRLKIDHENQTITGGANHSPVQLKFVWTSESFAVEGGANISPVQFYVNWKQGLLTGYSNHSPVKLEFDMKEGIAGENIVEIKGYANYSPVQLKFDKISGKLTGGMNYSPVDLTFVNADLYDFLQYFFVFLKKN